MEENSSYTTPERVRAIVDAAIGLGFRGRKHVKFFSDGSWEAEVDVEFPEIELVDIDSGQATGHTYNGIGLRFTHGSDREHPVAFLAYVSESGRYDDDLHPHASGDRGSGFCTAGGAVEEINDWIEKGLDSIAIQSAFATARQFNPYDAYRMPEGYRTCDCGSGYTADSYCDTCAHDTCDDCSRYCEACDSSACVDCLSYCEECQSSVCRYCASFCHSCMNTVCERCMDAGGSCAHCNEQVCPSCSGYDRCIDCGDSFCQRCSESGRADLVSCDECYQTVCDSCAYIHGSGYYCKACYESIKEAQDE